MTPNTPTATTWPPCASASHKHNPRYRCAIRPTPRAPPAPHAIHSDAAKSNTPRNSAKRLRRETVSS